MFFIFCKKTSLSVQTRMRLKKETKMANRSYSRCFRLFAGLLQVVCQFFALQFHSLKNKSETPWPKKGYQQAYILRATFGAPNPPKSIHLGPKRGYHQASILRATFRAPNTPCEPTKTDRTDGHLKTRSYKTTAADECCWAGAVV